MPELNTWTAAQPLSELTPYADWDTVSAMIASLRIYLFEHGTIPTWNYVLCGGRPELAEPYSWAYTWPSLFAYALRPGAAIIAVWIAMTVIGFFAMRGLLLRWTRHGGASMFGAGLYVFSGVFSARFNAGHITFAFYHLIPLLMLVFEVALERRLACKKALGLTVLTAGVAFLFFSAGLPHALMHFYPAFLLLVGIRLLASFGSFGWRATLRAALPLAIAHLLGAGLAAYKLWPVIRWQLELPRTGILWEAYSPVDVILNTLVFVPSYATPWTAPGYVYPAWGYNAFVGPMTWLLALLAIGILLARLFRRQSESRGPLDPATAVFATILVLAGLALALGNASKLGPGLLFRHVPLLSGIRAFNRYQVLLVFGLVILAAGGYTVVLQQVDGRRARYAALALVAVTLGPVLGQTAAHVWKLPARAHSEILAGYPSLGEGKRPVLIGAQQPKRIAGPWGVGHELALLEHGYWVANCKTDLTSAQAFTMGAAESSALSFPAPERLRRVGHDTLELTYPSGRTGRVELNLHVLDSFEFSAPVRRDPSGRVSFDLNALGGRPLVVKARYPGPREGAWASAATLVVGSVLLLAWFATGQRRC